MTRERVLGIDVPADDSVARPHCKLALGGLGRGIDFLGEDAGILFRFGSDQLHWLAAVDAHLKRNLVALLGGVGVVVGNLHYNPLARFYAKQFLPLGIDRAVLLADEVVGDRRD